LVSVAGLAASWSWDLPTGAAVVTAFGAAIALVAAALGFAGMLREVRAKGVVALAPVLVVLGIAAVLAGGLLVANPRIDHLWLDALERAAPALQEAFLTEREREARVDAVESVDGARKELSRLQGLQDEVRWGTRTMDEEKQERMRQYIAGRSEIAAGDELVLGGLRAKARERQRFPVGIPVALAGALMIALGMRARPTRAK
jgi:zinc/manganese transport system permease protein